MTSNTDELLVPLAADAVPSIVVAGERVEALSSSTVNRSVPRRKFSISSHVIPGLMVALDSFVILSVALITYLAIVADRAEDPSYYAAAIGFVWLVTVMLMNFAGLYQFEPMMRPLRFADKIGIAFATTFLFLLAAAFSLKISTEFSRLWIVSFAIGTCTATM